ncbi:MAG: hypothetical protein K8R21_03050 [Leptospira sp.]|nr:hypothetical protein [Leptospira sp.]
MLLLLKGTYATDEPLAFDEYSNGSGQLYQDDSGSGTNDPAFDLTNLPAAKDLPIFIDIGEIRISTQYQKGIASLTQIKDAKDSKRFWDFIAPERQVYCTLPPYSAGDSTCRKTGLSKMDDFLSGKGAVYPSNGPTSETYGDSAQQNDATRNGVTNGTQYYYTGVYLRSILTGFGRENGGTIINTFFDNTQIFGGGVNIVPRNNFNPGTDDATKTTAVPQLFPLFYSVQAGQSDMTIRPGSDPYILEIRTNFKENLMVHSYVTPLGYVDTLVGFSDWNKTHNGEPDMGGNLLTRSRIIYPEFASSLEISGGTKSIPHYYAVYRKDEQDFFGQLPLVSSPVKQGVTKIKYIHEGQYRLQCRGDITRVDGNPETIVRETFFTISPEQRKQTTQVSLTCP